MNDTDLSRRTLIGGAAAVAGLLLPMREALAQTRISGGDWFAMVRTHHQMIAETMQNLIDSQDALYEKRDRLQRTVAFQLSAHATAEENVLYPALALTGMAAESDKLYLDQAHAKVMNAELQWVAAPRRTDDAWFNRVRALRNAVLRHAQEEETRLYPQLRQKLDAQQNAALTTGYLREFATVQSRAAVGESA
jgi:hemerythrin superfamily protein